MQHNVGTNKHCMHLSTSEVGLNQKCVQLLLQPLGNLAECQGVCWLLVNTTKITKPIMLPTSMAKQSDCVHSFRFASLERAGKTRPDPCNEDLGFFSVLSFLHNRTNHPCITWWIKGHTRTKIVLLPASHIPHGQGRRLCTCDGESSSEIDEAGIKHRIMVILFWKKWPGSCDVSSSEGTTLMTLGKKRSTYR